MNELQIFKSDTFGEVRTVVKDNEPWFVAADVCEFFGVTNRNRVLQNLDEDEKGGTQIDTPGGVQTVTIINEAGLYTLLFYLQPTKARGVSDEYIATRCEQLRKYKRWITHEVIPSIRKHGAYITTEAAEKIMSDPDSWIKLLTALKEEREGKEVAEAKCAALESDNYKLADTVDKLDKQVMKLTESRDSYEKLYKEYRIKNYFTDICIDKGENLCIRDTAKELGVKETELVKLLIERKYLYRRKQKQNRLFPYSSPQCAGMFVVKEVIFGRGLTYQTQTLVTPAGRAKLTAECARAGLLPMAIENPAFEWEVAR